MLACGSLFKEGDFSGYQHFQFLNESLKVYDKTIENIFSLIGDNRAVSRLLTKLGNVPLIGCSCHKFNIAIENWIEQHPNLEKGLNVVRGVMRTLLTLKNSVTICSFTHFDNLMPNKTRWYGKFRMLGRYFSSEMVLKNIESVDKLLQPTAQRRALETATPCFQYFESMKVILQERGMYISDVQFIFDEVCAAYSYIEKN